MHQVTIAPHPQPWGWNGDVHRPTFTPSIKVISANERGPTCCHSYVAEGFIDFLDDCTHALRGRHPIPDWPRPDWSGSEPATSGAPE